MSEKDTEIEIDDDALALAAGGITPGPTSPSYTYNSTIYFQSSIGDEIS